MQPKPFKIILKPSSYPTPFFRRGPINLSTPTFPNISLTKTMTNLFIVSIITGKRWNNLYFLPEAFQRSWKSNLMAISRRSLLNLSTANLGSINLTETMVNLLVAWKFNKK